MEKLKYVHKIGGKGRPIPTMAMTETNEGDRYVRLGILDEPIEVDSNLEYGKFMGEFYRNLPTPSLLNDFLSGLQNRYVANTNPKSRMLETYLGSAGAGKTFRAELTGRLVHEKGALLVDCGGKNLRELLFETVVDNTKAKDLFTKIDALLEKYNAGTDKTALKATIMVLRKNLGEAFSEENGRVGVDWVLAAEKGILTQKDARDALEFVSKSNGLEQLDSSALGLKTQEGPLIRAWKEGRPIILDEYNKSREGTGASLQVLLQVFAGEKSSHTVSGDGISFTFDRKDKKPGFFVTVTGNTTKDGGSTHGLEQSAYSRLSPKFIADPNKLDWEHRICQCLTGVPMSTLWRSQENMWWEVCAEAEKQGKQNPFVKLCRQIRLAGLTEEEKSAVPESQLILIDNYRAVLQTASQLADFYIAWSNAINPDTQKATDYLDEIDEEYSKMVGLNLRKMIEHVNTALQPRVNGSDEDKNFWDLSIDFEKPLDISRAQEHEPLEKLGTNLKNIIIESVENTTFNNDPNVENRKTGLRQYLYTVMEEKGIIPTKKKIKSGGVQTIESLLNIHVERPDEKYREYATLICDELRKSYPELNGVEDFKITPPAIFETAFSRTAEKQSLDDLLVPNIQNLDDFSEKPFELFKISHDGDNKNKDDITRSQMLISLTFPQGAKYFVQQILTGKEKKRSSIFDMFNDDHLFASQEDKTNSNGEMVLLNLAHTKDDTLLFILSKKSNKTLIVGNETISDNLGALLERQNIKYVSRNSTSAELDNAFENTFESESEEILSYITEKLGGDIKSLPQLVKGVKPSVLAKPIMFHKNTRG